jgi:hypothetical protein
MTVMEQPKKKPGKKAEMSSTERMVAANTPPLHTTIDAALHVVKPEPKPGDKDFDWQTEYPGEDVYVYTVPEGTRSPAGLTIGLGKLTEDRAPNPGMMREAYEDGGFAPMWLFVKCVSSPASLKVQNQLRPPEYNEMLRGWAKFAGIELSE